MYIILSPLGFILFFSTLLLFISSMASSSPKKSCFHCKDSNSVEYRDGWQLRNGDFSLLCDQCASAYEDRRFCEIFHSDSDGWRDCDSCGKLVHCGCIVSLHAFMLLDFGGVMCTECSRKNFTMASNRCPSSLWSATPDQLLQHLTDPVEVKQLDGTKGVISGINHGADPIGLFDSAVRYTLPNESNGQTLAPESLSQIQAPPPQLGEIFYSNSLDEADTSHEAQIEYGKIHLQPQHWPKISDHELQQISRNSNLVVIPLFEKTLSVSDADPKLGRLVIPKKYAEAYLPKISHAQGFPIKVHDTRGKEWVFHFRFWPNNNSKMYVLEGIKDYMISMQWQPGDKVIFYQIEPEGNLVMGLKKASSVLPPLKELPPILG